MSKLLASILSGLIDKYVGRLVSWFAKQFKKKERIEKANQQIDDELKAVNDAVAAIKNAKLKGEPVTDEMVERLKRSNDRLSDGFFS